MIPLTKEVIEAVLKHLTDRLAMAILFLSLIFFTLALIPGTGVVRDWSRNHWVYWVVGGLGAICYLPTGHLLRWSEHKIESVKRLRRLNTLTDGEKAILKRYVSNGERSIRFRTDDAEARGLADDGVLYSPEVALDAYGREAFNIQDWARIHLAKHPEILS